MATSTVIRKNSGSITAATSKFGGINPTPTQAESRLLADEQHDSPAQLAERWALSSDFIRDLFKDEVGVIVIDRPETLRKRGYSTIRIPRSVSHRVHCRLRSK
jgi:hypothetical protein